MKILAYLRVSTDVQADEGQGLEVQEAAVRGWARDAGHELRAVLREEGVSGAKELDDRPALAEAFALLKDDRAEGLVVYRLDRLARDLIVQETLLAELRKLGAEVFSTAPGEQDYLVDDPDDPSRRLIRQILGAVSEYERSMIALRLRAGRRRKADAGGYAGGAPRFGERAEDRELTRDDREQLALERIAELAGAGVSLRDMAGILDAEGHRPKRADHWHPETLRRIVKRLEAA